MADIYILGSAVCCVHFGLISRWGFARASVLDQRPIIRTSFGSRNCGTFINRLQSDVIPLGRKVRGGGAGGNRRPEETADRHVLVVVVS